MYTQQETEKEQKHSAGIQQDIEVLWGQEIGESSGLSGSDSMLDGDQCALADVDSALCRVTVRGAGGFLISQRRCFSDSHLNSLNLRASASLYRSLAQSVCSRTHRSVMKTRQPHIPSGATPLCVMVNREM